MAGSKEDIANQALARIGEPEIASFTEGTEAADKLNQLYEPTILGLLSRYQWDFASNRKALSKDGAVSPANEWQYGFLMPTPRVDLVGMPYRFYSSTALRAPEFFDYEISGRHVLANVDVMVVEYTQRKAEALWPGYFEELAVEAVAAKIARPITENSSLAQECRENAFGTPSERGEGGLFGIAMRADVMGQSPRGLLDESDPMTEARFGGSRGDGTW